MWNFNLINDCPTVALVYKMELTNYNLIFRVLSGISNFIDEYTIWDLVYIFRFNKFETYSQLNLNVHIESINSQLRQWYPKNIRITFWKFYLEQKNQIFQFNFCLSN